MAYNDFPTAHKRTTLRADYDNMFRIWILCMTSARACVCMRMCVCACMCTAWLRGHIKIRCVVASRVVDTHVPEKFAKFDLSNRTSAFSCDCDSNAISTSSTRDKVYAQVLTSSRNRLTISPFLPMMLPTSCNRRKDTNVRG